MPSRLSLQLYSTRNFGSPATVLPLLAEAGYKEVEGYGGVYQEPARLRRLLDKQKLTMPSGHFGLDMLTSDRNQVLAIAATLGIRHVYCPYLAPEARPRSATGWRRLGRQLAEIGIWLRSEGLSFGWHNHDFEFEKMPDGSYPIEHIFAAAPMLDWECDVAWIARAKANPLKWIKSQGERITAVHVKDIAPKGKNIDEDGWADVGHGVLDWRALIEALQNSRTLHYVVEHDNPSDLARFARRSFTFLSSI